MLDIQAKIRPDTGYLGHISGLMPDIRSITIHSCVSGMPPIMEPVRRARFAITGICCTAWSAVTSPGCRVADSVILTKLKCALYSQRPMKYKYHESEYMIQGESDSVNLRPDAVKLRPDPGQSKHRSGSF